MARLAPASANAASDGRKRLRIEQRNSATPIERKPEWIKIARDWNLPRDGAGFVTEFEVDAGFLDGYEVHQVGGRTILEYWIPAEDLDEFNRHIDGQIQVVDEFR